MTESNAEPTSAPPDSTSIASLRRRATDRVAAGVASGVADHLNVDPLLVRVMFVGLVLFNGAGFFIYLAAWLFIPVEGRDTSIVEGWIRRLGVSGDTAGTVAWIVLGVIGALVVLDWTRPDGVRGIDPGFAFALVVIAGGILLLRRSPPGTGPTTSGGAPAADSVVTQTAAPMPSVRERRIRAERDRSPLGLYVLGLLFVAIGSMAAIDGTTAAEILPRTYAAVAVALVGIGLLVGAWWGRARWLILIGLLLVPVTIASSYIPVALDAGWGDRRIEPVSADELRNEYELAAGRLTLDLRDLPESTSTHEVSATIGMGRLHVILPEDAEAEVRSEVGAGTSELFGAFHEGTGLDDRESHDGTGSTFVLNLEAGLGSIFVSSASAGE